VSRDLSIYVSIDKIASFVCTNFTLLIINLFNVQLTKSQTLYKQYYIIAEINKLEQTKIDIIINEIRNNSNYLTIKLLLTK